MIKGELWGFFFQHKPLFVDVVGAKIFTSSTSFGKLLQCGVSSQAQQGHTMQQHYVNQEIEGDIAFFASKYNLNFIASVW